MKKHEFRGEEVEKREKGKKGNFHCTSEKKYLFEKGGGAKISYFWEIYTPEGGIRNLLYLCLNVPTLSLVQIKFSK